MSDETSFNYTPQPEIPEWRKRLLMWADRIMQLPPLIWLPLLLVAFFNKMALSNLILARGDTYLYFYPYWEAAANALQNGRIPLWNPQLFMGVPFIANSQVGFFYPLNWPLWLLLPIPYAVSVSILVHLFIAGWGAYLAAQRTIYLDRSAALATAVLFALGGYVTAQVEHVNQLQGMAWFPWFFVVLAYAADEKAVSRLVVIGKTALGLATLFALQLLAGHTQTAFMSGVAVLVWGVAMWVVNRLNETTENSLLFRFQYERFKDRVPLALLLGIGLMSLITAIQLIPTLELTQFSSRQGGLTVNEVLSFSLHPLLLAKSLLPAYEQSLFSEYVAVLPITALILAVIGAWQWRNWRGVLPTIALVVVGLLLAVGQFDPLYWLLARLPGFNLFRVPARWLLLYAFGMAMLAGLGWQIVLDRWLLRTLDWRTVPERARENLWQVERPLRIALFIIIGLMLWSVIANFLAAFIPTGPEAPYEAPSLQMVTLWGGELLLIYFLLGAQRLRYFPQARFKVKWFPALPVSPWPLAFISLLVLFVSTRTHSYNNLTTPEAYFDLRPSVTRLQAMAPCRNNPNCNLPPDRMLSLSHIFFDPGDQAEIDTIYAEQLPIPAQQDYTVAIKQKEIVSPNLPMVYGLASVDGFDGGVLPLRAYSEAMRLILPDGVVTTDGRLREQLTAVPAPKWLDLFNARYIITDKTGDLWRKAIPGVNLSIFYDMQHPTTISTGEAVSIGYVPDFTATALYIVTEGVPGMLQVSTTEGASWELEPFAVESGLVRYGWPASDPNLSFFEEAAPTELTLHAKGGDWTAMAATLVNEETLTFLPVSMGNYRQIHSGDVKIYENLDVLPRVLLLHDWQWVDDVAASVAVMDDETFDVRETAVIISQNDISLPEATGVGTGKADIVRYRPEKVVVRTESDTDSMLLLTDAHYPGWEATIDGGPGRIFQADGLFRVVFVPAGTHEITFTFNSLTFSIGGLVSLLGLLIWLVLVVTLFGLERFRMVRI
ncbi:MAG: hypothetical protein DWQ04_24360 [Chloroflexi bacterium]|nr:MAG: hypothetical protein DWQ04_24360 [Chloroflexota bacterium]